mgnify:CR=1 FL=1
MLEHLQKEHENLLSKLRDEAHWMQHGVTARRKRNVLRKDNYFALKEKVKTNPAKINKMKLDIERFYVQLDGELEKMKQLSLKKDDLLVKSRNQYIIIGMFIVIVFALFGYHFICKPFSYLSIKIEKFICNFFFEGFNIFEAYYQSIEFPRLIRIIYKFIFFISIFFVAYFFMSSYLLIIN